MPNPSPELIALAIEIADHDAMTWIGNSGVRQNDGWLILWPSHGSKRHFDRAVKYAILRGLIETDAARPNAVRIKE